MMSFHLDRRVFIAASAAILGCSANADQEHPVTRRSDGDRARPLGLSCSRSGEFAAVGQIEFRYGVPVQVWSVPERSLISLNYAHSQEILATGFSSDGSLLISAARDNTLIVWKGDRFEKLSMTIKVAHPVTQIHFAPDDKWFATYDLGGNLIKWGLDGAKIAELCVGSVIAGFGISADGKQVIHGGKLNTSFDSMTGKIARSTVQSLAITDAALWHIEREVKIDLGSKRTDCKLLMSPKTNVVAVYGNDTPLQIFSAGELNRVCSFTNVQRMLFFSGDDRSLLSPEARQLDCYDPVTGAKKATLQHDLQVCYEYAVSPDWVYLFGVVGKGLVFCRLRDGQQMKKNHGPVK
jgi:WD40 repeat protein